MLRVLAFLFAATFGLRAIAQMPKQSTGIERFDTAIKQGVEFLRTEVRQQKPSGVWFLAAYTMLKAGVPADDVDIVPVLAGAKNFARGRIAGQEQNYVAGCAAMLLAEADGERFRPELRRLRDFLLANQGTDGSWDYPQRKVGDTSQTQYALLGLWSCRQADVEVAQSVFDRAASWHLKNIGYDGGWAYHPGKLEGPGGGRSTHNMTFAGIGSLGICRLLLHPNHGKPKDKLFGVLEPLEPPTQNESQKPANNFRPENSFRSIQEAITRGVAWTDARWKTSNPIPGHEMYFYYAMERAMALKGSAAIAAKWYEDCGYVLVNAQTEDGGWPSRHDRAISTSFALLFLVRSTQQAIEKGIGGGLLNGRRGLKWGLPEDGPATPENETGLPDVNELLKWIQSQPNLTDVPREDIEAITNLVLATKPSKLRENMPALKKVLEHPQAEIRESVLLAMSRSGDVRIAPLLIDALHDMDVHVMLKAEHALRMVSRKPRGVGMTADLLTQLQEKAAPEAESIVRNWRALSAKRWRDWYVRVRPWDERDDLWEIGGE